MINPPASGPLATSNSAAAAHNNRNLTLRHHQHPHGLHSSSPLRHISTTADDGHNNPFHTNPNINPNLNHHPFTFSHSVTMAQQTQPTASTGPSTTTITTPIIKSRAHEMKIALGATPHVPTQTNLRKRLPEHDPENHAIKNMRVDEKKSWGEIARILNERRIQEGKVCLFRLVSFSVFHLSVAEVRSNRRKPQ
jgi:hypothetical protein